MNFESNPLLLAGSSGTRQERQVSIPSQDSGQVVAGTRTHNLTLLGRPG